MSINTHGMPSRVRAIAEIGRLLGDPRVPGADRRAALALLVQDHADLDEVEALAALWALAQVDGAQPAAGEEGVDAQPPGAVGADDDLARAAREALLDCGAQLMHGSDGAQQFLDVYQRWFGARASAGGRGAHSAFLRIERLALDDAELAARLALFR